jgi:sodium transport system permease protein
MRWRIAATIARKELLEALRDRKTLALTLLLPLLLYPGLMLLVTQVAASQAEKLEAVDSRVVVGGALDSSLVDALRAAEGVELIEIDGVPPADPLAADADAIVLIEATDGSGTEWRARVRFRSVIEESAQALDRINGAVSDWRDAEVQRRLDAAGLPASTLTPVDFAPEDLSPTQQRGGYVLGSVLPLLVLVTIMMGALYPAIDVTAGEKERGTIQTLFTAPVRAGEVVAGKYAAVVVLGIITGAANLGSIALVFGHNLILAPEMTQEFDFRVAPSVIAGLGACVVLVAALIGAVLMCAAVLARDFKDAQTFVTPVYLLCIVPGLVAQLPGFELGPQTALLPIVGPVLLMRSMLLDGVRFDELALVAAGAAVHVTLAVALATRLFATEAVIAGERAPFALFSAARDIRPRPAPAAGEAVVWWAVALLLLYYLGSALQTASPRLGLLATLWLVVLAPTLLVARRLKLDVRETFLLRRPTLAHAAAGVLLGISAWVLAAAASSALGGWLPQPGEELAERMASDLAQFFPPPTNAWEVFTLVFIGAISPAICEELFFRGFVLSGLRTSLRPLAAVAVTALLFAAFHLSIYRLFGTALLGLLMGLLAWRSRSIVPAMLMHALNNACVLLLVPRDLADESAARAALGWALLPAVAGGAAGLALLLGTRAARAER